MRALGLRPSEVAIGLTDTGETAVIFDMRITPEALNG